MSAHDWEREEWKCEAVRCRHIAVPDVGESERVLVADVLARKAWFPVAGLFILRDGDAVQYVGLASNPLRLRLTVAISSGKTWTKADYRTWTVTLQRAPSDYPDDLALERRIIAEHAPPFNVLGRPRREMRAIVQ